jgi:hypothetical protein
MKMNRLFLLSVFCGITILLNTGCKDEECGDPSGEQAYFIFGAFYGECVGGGCINIFKVENGQLYEDDLDLYPNGTTPIDAHWNQLSNDKYEEVKNLAAEIPMSLFNETDHILGIPDGGDWGGIYVEVNYSGHQALKSGFWLLDKNESNMAQVYNDFVDKIERRWY